MSTGYPPTTTTPPPPLPGEPGWFDGLSGGTWFLLGIAVCCLVMWIVTMALAAMSNQADLRVRGWENRPRQMHQWDEPNSGTSVKRQVRR